jgi:NADH-quinone oxidoreductase subunit A
MRSIIHNYQNLAGMDSSYPTLWPFLIYAIASLLLVVAMLVASYFLGERHQEPATDTVYEAGIEATGSARLLFPIHFYLIGMFFVIFDLEVVFIVAWAISAKIIGWAGYIAIATFIAVLVAVLVYEWRIGAFNFGPSGKRILKAYHNKLRESGGNAKAEPALSKNEIN